MAQTRLAARLLKEATGEDVEVVPVTSRGDVNRVQPIHRLGAPGAFTAELQEALLAGEIDAAVHSLKDMPIEQPPEAPVVAVLPRGDVRDALIVRTDWFAPDGASVPLRPGARVGTSAPRRQAQLLDAAPEAVPVDIRGNVETRLRLVGDGLIDALLMAEAPFSRVDLPLPAGLLHVPIPADRYPGSPGQGAIAIQARAGTRAAEAFALLNDAPTAAAIALERRILSHLGGGCGLPLGAWARAEGAGFRVTATFATASERLVRVDRTGPEPAALAREVATALLEAVKGDAAAPHPPAPTPSGGRLAGRTVLTLQDPDVARPYLEALTAAGARAAAWPTTVQEPLATDLDALPSGVASGWARAAWALVGSARAVPALRALADRHPNPGARIGCVGPATARALRAHGFPVHLVSPDGTGAGLAWLLAKRWRPQGPVLLPGALEPHPDLRVTLEREGIETVPWPVYRTRPLDPLPPPPIPLPVDTLVVPSPSAARALQGLDPAGVARHWVAFGPSTADALRDAGLPVHTIAPRRTPAAVLEVIP